MTAFADPTFAIPGKGARSRAFFGRAAEQRRLFAAWERVQTVSERRAIFISGEPGIGKTSLVRATVRRFADDGAVVLFGRCLDLEHASPYHPLAEALDVASQEFQRGEVPGREHRVLKLLTDQFGDRPGALVVEDLQWADRSTLDALLYMLAAEHPTPFLLIATVRPEGVDEVGAVRKMLADLRRLPIVDLIELGPLDRRDVADLGRAVLGRSLGESEIDQLCRWTDSNPFAVEHLAESLGKPTRYLPTTLRDAVLIRVDDAAPAARSLLNALAVGSPPIRDDVLADVVDLPITEYLHTLRALVARRLVSVDAYGVRPSHQLINDIVASALLPAESQYFHRRFADVLDGVAGAEPAAALHKLAIGRIDAALADLIRAGADADAHQNYADAWAHWSLAARHCTAGTATTLPRTELVRRAITAGLHCAEHDAAIQLLDDIVGTAGHGLEWAHVLRGRLLAARGSAEQALNEFDQLALLPTKSQEQTADVAVASAEIMLELGQYETALERVDVVIATKSSPARVAALAIKGEAQVGLDDPAGRFALQRSYDDARTLNDPVLTAATALRLASRLTGPLNEVRAGIEVAEAAAEDADRHGLARSFGVRLRTCAAEGHFRLGTWDDADALISDASSAAPVDSDLTNLVLARSRLSVARGRFATAHLDLDRARTLTAGRPRARFLLPMKTLTSGLAMWEQQPRPAFDVAWHALQSDPGEDRWLLAPLVWHAHRALAEMRLTSAESVPDTVIAQLDSLTQLLDRKYARKVGPIADTVSCYLALCVAERARRGLGDAASAWRHAEQMWSVRGQPYAELYAGMRWAESLLLVNARNLDAAAKLRQCHDRAGQMGAVPLQAEIWQLATRARVTLSGPHPPADDEPTAGPLARLTPREADVLTQLANGARNRDIARALFISERTVGVHVSSILAKMQVRSRLQAAAIYQRSTR